MIRPHLANACTFAGHLLSIAWLLGAPWWVALLGLACDALDGHVARRLKATTRFGSLYDWTVDCTMAAAIAMRLSRPEILLSLVPLQVYLRRRRIHVSGRAALTVLCILWSFSL